MSMLRIIEKFYSAASRNLEEGEYLVAAENFSKVVFVAIDYLIKEKTGLPPANHEKRFDVVRYRFPELYPLLEETFKVHRRTYREDLTEEQAEMVSEFAKKLAKRVGAIK
jgi:HEPN domain-containing protein